MAEIFFPCTSSGSPDSEAWHQWRDGICDPVTGLRISGGGIGGSDSPVVGADAGLNSRPTWGKGIGELWMHKTGTQKIPFVTNFAVERGKRGEEPARLAFEEATGVLLMPMFFEMDDHPFVRASCDGVTFNRDRIGEIKCGGEKMHTDAKNGIIPDYYFTQMLHQGLAVWGDPRKGGWTDKVMYFISYVPETGDLAWVEQPATDIGIPEKAVALLEAEIKFWEMVEKMQQPCGDAWAEAATDYISAKLAAELADATLKAVSVRLEALMGDRTNLDGGGITGSISERAGSVSYKDMAEALMRDYGVDDPNFPLRFKGEAKKTFTVRIKTAAGKKKAPKAEGGLSLEAARAELSRINDTVIANETKAFAW